MYQHRLSIRSSTAVASDRWRSVFVIGSVLSLVAVILVWLLYDRLDSVGHLALVLVVAMTGLVTSTLRTIHN